MAADSITRRILKRLLFPFLNERNYQWIQSLAKAWDIRTGSWSEPELDLIPFAVRPGETALDIGANFGLYSYHLSRAVGPSGLVYAFEPVPFTSASLETVCRLLRLKNVRRIPKGCSQQNGNIPFTLPIQSVGPLSAGLAHIGTRNNERVGKGIHFQYDKTRQILCEVIALDDFLSDASSISFIKCDIEGAELLAFRGAEGLIRRFHPTVLCEINPWFLDGYGIRLTDLIDFFSSKGYRLFRYEPRGKQKPLRAVRQEEVVEDNYLFVHPNRSDRFLPVLRSPCWD